MSANAPGSVDGDNALDPVILSRPEPGIGVICLDRPARRNALNLDVKHRVTAALNELELDAAIAVIIVTGANGVFVAGTDTAEMADMMPSNHANGETNAMFVALRRCPKPLIAAVEGYALGGGCELALACDMIVAGSGALFGQPEIRVGIMPGAGGTQILVRSLGKHRAMKLLLTGDPLPAADADALGLISQLVEEGRALDTAMALAQRIAAMPPLAVRAIKRAVQAGLDAPLSVGLALERREFEALFATEDQKEGMAAFLAKRRPVFKGR
ncbi:MAG: enoyl-CoA hydratase-related protein [Janthinobacterium lividum]